MSLNLLRFLLLGCAAALPAQSIPEFEPNDTPSQATFAQCGWHVESRLSYVGDIDWFTFTLAAPGRVLAQVGTGPDGVVTDTEMELRDGTSSLNLIAYNDDDDRSWMSLVSEYLPAGTYYVMVKGFGNSLGAYSLDLQLDSNGTAQVIVPEAAEPNGPFGVGTPTLLASGQLGYGQLTTGDVDYWSFTLTTPTVVRIETGKGRSGTTSTDTILYLRDAQDTQLAYDDDGAPGAWSLIIATLQPGTYYADVQGYNGTNVGTYTILMHTVDATVTLPDNPEPNDDPLLNGVPSVIACGVPGEGEITAGDSDWWTLSVSQDTFVDITVWSGQFTATAMPLKNSLLSVYDANSQLLVSDNDDFYNTMSRQSIFLTPGTYYIAVAANNATNAGTYFLQVRCNENALYHNFAGGCVGSNTLAPRWNVREWELPMLGTTLVSEFTNCPANTVVLPFAGFSRTLTSNSLSLPFDLTPLGAPGCMVEVDPLITQLLLTNAQGTATTTFAIPFVPALSGIVFAQQALVLDLGANSLGVTTTNAGTGLITASR
ncbi:MAG: PPC domain-containing protein [Planctomycetes bacterium]|nr:PPC domain-containing protein [Planctomycetota bacterium]